MFIQLIGLVGIGLYAKKKYSFDFNFSKHLIPFSGNEVRDQQLQEFTSDNIKEKTPLQKLNDSNMKISLVSLGFSSIGYLIYHPLGLLSLPGIIYITHFPFLQSYHEIVKEKKVTVDLMSASTKILLVLYGRLFFASIAISLYSINRILLAKVSDDSKKNIIDVFKQCPTSVWISCKDGLEKEVSFESLQLDDIIIVNTGHTIPVDGCIIEGLATIDQHILTGESQPVEKEVGSDVFAMTLVLSGKIYIKITHTGEKTTAAQIACILNNTISNKTEAQLWAKEFSDKTVFPTFVVSGLALPVVGPTAALAILNSHFNYRASIASTIGVMNYLSMASSKGILIKDGTTFEILNTVDIVVFDKTGTLTKEQPQVHRIHCCSNLSEAEILTYAAAAEDKQVHPIAKAILQKAMDWKLELPRIKKTSYQVGYGLSVEVDGHIVHIGSIRFFEHECFSISDKVRQIQEQCNDQGSPMVAVSIDDTIVGIIELQTTMRAGVKNLIQALRQRGVKSMYIISGDHEAPTRQLAQELGIDHYFAEVLPTEKANLIKQLQSDGKSVCYLGDGINDAIALKQADVSISLRGASTVATDAAQVIFMDETLNHLPYLFDMAQQFDHNIKKIVMRVVTPSVVSAAGVIWFVHGGLLLSFIFPQIGLIAGVLSAMHPVIPNENPEKNKKE